MELTADPGLTLNTFTAKPGSASADVLNGPRRSAERGYWLRGGRSVARAASLM